MLTPPRKKLGDKLRGVLHDNVIDDRIIGNNGVEAGNACRVGDILKAAHFDVIAHNRGTLFHILSKLFKRASLSWSTCAAWYRNRGTIDLLTIEKRNAL
jgi:hypothetical protein